MNQYEIPAYIRRELDPVKREKLLTEWKSQNKNWARKMKEVFVMWLVAVSVAGVLFWRMAELDWVKCEGEQK